MLNAFASLKCSKNASIMYKSLSRVHTIFTYRTDLDNGPFHSWVFSFVLQCNPLWMRCNLGLKLQNSPKLPHMEAEWLGKTETPVTNISNRL